MKAPCKFLIPTATGARVVRAGEEMDSQTEAFARASGLIADAPVPGAAARPATPPADESAADMPKPEEATAKPPRGGRR